MLKNDPRLNARQDCCALRRSENRILAALPENRDTRARALADQPHPPGKPVRRAGRLTGEGSLLYAPGYTSKGETNEDLIQEALNAAGQADVVVICAG